MSRHRTALWICILSSLALTAATAPQALAIVGTRAYTCKNLGGTTHSFADAHCKEATGTGSYEHVAVPESTKTELEGNNITTGSERSTALLESTQSGVVMQIRIPTWHYHEWLTTTVWPSGEWYTHWEWTYYWTEAEVSKPAGKGCKIKTGTVNSKALRATTLEQGMALKIEPETGSVIAEFEVEGCSVAALNGSYKLEGSFKLVPNGATLTSTHAEITEQGTLKLRGQKAGISTSLTVNGRKSPEESFTPVGLTTVSSP
jgi:hypothetical protein